MRLILGVAALFVVGGCGSTTVNPGGGDLGGAGGDMALGAVDMAAPANQKHVTTAAGSCYTLATAGSTQDNPCGADVVFLQGALVDVSAASGAANVLCQLTGTFASAAEVPSDYKACAFTPYIEGGGGLAGAGIIVIDRAMAHHYKWRVASNTGASIVFDQIQID